MKAYLVPDSDARYSRVLYVFGQKGVLKLSADDGAAFCQTFYPWGDEGKPEKIEIPYEKEIEIPSWLGQVHPEEITGEKSFLVLSGERAKEFLTILQVLINGLP